MYGCLMNAFKILKTANTNCEDEHTAAQKEEDVTASLSGGIPSELQSHHPPVAFSPWATPWASKTVGLLGRGHFVTHSSLCLFVTSPLFLTLLVVSDSLPLLQGATNTTVPHIYKHRLGQMARATNLPPFCYFLSPSCSLSSAMVDHNFLVFID